VPELPDLEAYIAALKARTMGTRLEKIRLKSPFLLRTVEPPLFTGEGRVVRGVSRLGKRIIFALEGDDFLLLHLMIAGRLHWKAAGARVSGRNALAAFEFSNGTLLLTEASRKKRAALHFVSGRAALAEFDRGGLEVLGASRNQFASALRKENHTLKRALTDPRLFSGIGNAYSDEILHRARVSPVRLTSKLTEEEVDRLFNASRSTLSDWASRLEAEAAGQFPEHVTAFREGMAVHGRFRKPCPDCGTPVQRIVFAENESNYCPTCQTGGKLLADRALSRLLGKDWPKTLEEMEERMKA
jgi:formamidopyrimidine-DNA glycosylase